MASRAARQCIGTQKARGDVLGDIHRLLTFLSRAEGSVSGEENDAVIERGEADCEWLYISVFTPLVR